MTRAITIFFFLSPLLAASFLFPAIAQSTDETVNADTNACLRSDDNEACERVYDYLYEKIVGAESSEDDKLLADLRNMAEVGCGLGNAWLCQEMADRVWDGELGWEQDFSQSVRLFERACELGSGYGCSIYGLAYEIGRSVPLDRAKAQKLYLQSCEMRSANGCQYYAELLLVDRINSEPQAPATLGELKGKCANRALDGPSCVALGIAYFRGGENFESDPTEAGKYWSKACARVADARGCYYLGMKQIYQTPMEDRHSPENLTAIQSLYRSCLLGDVPACEFMVVAGQDYAWDYQDVIAQGLYGRCLNRPSLEDCKIAGDAFMSGIFPDNHIKGEYAPDKALRAWLTACRNFNVRCIEAANMHLGDEKFTQASPNLAIGILETACEKGDTEACSRKDEVIESTGGVNGSYIDPMLDDDERFLLARFDIESGETQRGRETLQWLAFLGYTHAQMYLANAYANGLDVAPRGERGKVRKLPYTLMNKKNMIYELFEAAARKGVPDAAMRVAVIKYYENDHQGSDSYEAAIYRALYLGAEGAVELNDAVDSQNKMRTDARLAAIREMNRQNIESRDNMDRETVQRAWDQYYKRQKEREKLEGGRVCGIVYGPGNSTYQTCMTRSTALKYYRGSF